MCHEPDTPITVHTGEWDGRPVRIVSSERTLYPLTSCCDAAVTYSSAIGEPVLCCKACWGEAPDVFNSLAHVDSLAEIASLLTVFGVPTSEVRQAAIRAQALALVQQKVTHTPPTAKDAPPKEHA